MYFQSYVGKRSTESAASLLLSCLLGLSLQEPSPHFKQNKAKHMAFSLAFAKSGVHHNPPLPNGSLPPEYILQTSWRYVEIHQKSSSFSGTLSSKKPNRVDLHGKTTQLPPRIGPSRRATTRRSDTTTPGQTTRCTASKTLPDKQTFRDLETCSMYFNTNLIQYP